MRPSPSSTSDAAWVEIFCWVETKSVWNSGLVLADCCAPVVRYLKGGWTRMMRDLVEGRCERDDHQRQKQAVRIFSIAGRHHQRHTCPGVCCRHDFAARRRLHQHFPDEQIFEHLAVQQHFLQLGRTLAAADIQALADDPACAAAAVQRAVIQRQLHREIRIARRQLARGEVLILAVAADLRTGQHEAIAFVHRPEVARHADFLAAGIALRLFAVIAQRAVERAQESGQAQQHQQCDHVDQRPGEGRQCDGEQRQQSRARDQQPERGRIQLGTLHFGLQPHRQIRHPRDQRGCQHQAGDERLAADLLPVQRAQQRHRRHRSQQVAARTLAGQCKADEHRGDPDPQQFLLVAHLAAPLVRDDKQRHDREGQQPGIGQEGQRVAPDAGAAPQQFRQVTKTKRRAPMRIELADVFADHEFLPHRVRIGIEHEPHREQRDRDRDRDRPLSAHPRAGIPAHDIWRCCRYQPRRPSVTGRPSAKDLYRKPMPIAMPSSSGTSQRDCERLPPVQQHEERQEQPEHLGRIGQERAAETVGGEEREKGQRGDKAGLQSAGEFSAEHEQHRRGQQRVDHAGVAQIPQRPVAAADRWRRCPARTAAAAWCCACCPAAIAAAAVAAGGSQPGDVLVRDIRRRSSGCAGCRGRRNR